MCACVCMCSRPVCMCNYVLMNMQLHVFMHNISKTVYDNIEIRDDVILLLQVVTVI